MDQYLGMQFPKNPFRVGVHALRLALCLSLWLTGSLPVNAATWDPNHRQAVQERPLKENRVLEGIPAAEVGSVYIEHLGRTMLLDFEASGDHGTLVHAPSNHPYPQGKVWVDQKQANHQFRDGRWCLVPEGAAAAGKQGLRWKGAFKASRPGAYTAEIYLSTEQALELGIQIGVGKSRASQSATTQSNHSRIQAISLGKVKVDSPGNTDWSLMVRGAKEGQITFSHLILRPAAEGEPIRQLADSSVELHARDATVHGIKLQYEPLPHKNTVGYWIHASDYPCWNFDLLRPGRYAVEVLQGCGKGHGGSEMNIVLHQTTLPFLVEDTGHFQHFVPRIVGEVTLPRPDHYRLELIPMKKAGGAVMDVRRIRLIPLASKP